MENAVQITPELYEQVKAMVLEEQRATNKARAKEREKAHREELEQVRAMFEPTRLKYTPLLAQRFKNTFTTGRTLYDIIDSKLAEAERIAVRTLGFYSNVDAYRDNKAEEANKLASEILDALLKQ